jgi:hypothetical protein
MKCSTIIVFIIISLGLQLSARDIVLLEKGNKAPISEREAILVLPGFGTLLHSPKNQKKNFRDKGYDVFIPDYISRRSMDKCVRNLDGFIKKHNLAGYKKVHVFSYIIGSWAINTWIGKNSLMNIASIVYDRSPLQERAPAILVKENPFLSRLMFGKLIRELSVTPYPALDNTAVDLGILIECRATKIMWKKRKSSEAMGPVLFEKTAMGQQSDDHFYVFMNHDDMYTRLEGAAPQLFYFFKTGRFMDDADRDPCIRDPFETFRKKSPKQ